MRIFYLGLPVGALVLDAHGFRPVVAAIGHPDAPGMWRLRRRAARAPAGGGGAPPGSLVLGRPDLGAPDVVRAIMSLDVDVLLSWFWPRRIPAELLARFPGRALGVHPSLLPRWRGPDPYFWAIASGDRVAGVSLHHLEAEYDTGDVVAQREVPIAPTDDAWSLAKKLDAPSLALLVLAATRAASGGSLAGARQLEELATPAPAPTPDDLAIDWRAPADVVERLVRAAAPSPGATATIGETEVDVVRARVADVEVPRALMPSEAFVGPEGVVVCAGDRRGILLERVIAGGAPLDGRAIAALVAGPR